jgi:hypothetical protein
MAALYRRRVVGIMEAHFDSALEAVRAVERSGDAQSSTVWRRGSYLATGVCRLQRTARASRMVAVWGKAGAAGCINGALSDGMREWNPRPPRRRLEET